MIQIIKFKRAAKIVALVTSAGLLFSCASHSHHKHPQRIKRPQKVLVIQHAPPPLKVEVRAVKPHQHAIWIPGRWRWQANAYVWVGGRWDLKPKGKAWVSGHWVKRPKGWFWIDGYWK